MSNPLILVSAVTLSFFLNTFSQPDSTTSIHLMQIAELREDVKQLRADIDNLKAEIKLHHSPSSVARNSSNDISPENKSGVDKAPVNNNNVYLITKSGKRHNSSCRYYNPTNCRPGGSNEGTACKLCGG